MVTLLASMVGGAFLPYQGTTDVNRVEAPVTVKAYLVCAFAAFGGICELCLLTAEMRRVGNGC